MAKKTLHDIYVEALTAHGSVIVKRLKGCTVMTRPKLEGSFYYVGCGGAIRAGTTRTNSVSLSETFKTKLAESTKKVPTA